MKYLIILLLPVFFISCFRVDKADNNRSQIINQIFNLNTKRKFEFYAFPKASPITYNIISKYNINHNRLYRDTDYRDSIIKKLNLKITPTDSLKEINNYLKKRGRLIVGINTNLTIPFLHNLKNNQIKNEYKKVFHIFKSIKNTSELNTSKINDNKYAVVLPYQNYYLKTRNKGFEKYDLVMNFSEIAFNKNQDKALIICSVNSSRLNSFSEMLFMKKTGKKWIIEDTIGLSIS